MGFIDEYLQEKQRWGVKDLARKPKTLSVKAANLRKRNPAEVCETLVKGILHLMLETSMAARGDDAGIPPVVVADDLQVQRERRGQLKDNIKRIVAAVKNDQASLSKLECLRDGLMVQICVADGDYEGAVPYGERFCTSLLQGATVGAIHAISSRHNLCQAYQQLSKYPEAKEQADQMMKDSEGDTSNTHFLTLALENAGKVYAAMGEYQDALEYQKRLLTIQEEHFREFERLTAAAPDTALGQLKVLRQKLQTERAVALNNKGDILRNLSRLSEAAEFFQQAADLAEELGNERFENMARSNLAVVSTALGGPADNLNILQRQLDGCDGDPMEQVKCLANMGQYLERMGQPGDMKRHYERGLEIARTCGQADREHEAEILMLKGNAEKDFSRCWDLYEKASDIASSIDGAASLQARIIGNKASRLSLRLRDRVFKGQPVDPLMLMRCEALHADAISRAEKLGDASLLGERKADHAIHVMWLKDRGLDSMISDDNAAYQYVVDALSTSEPGSTSRADLLRVLAGFDVAAQRFDAAECIDILTAHRGGLSDAHKISVFDHKHSEVFDMYIQALMCLSRYQQALDATGGTQSQLSPGRTSH